MPRWNETKAPGFTLIEMLVCLAILAILAALFANGFTASREKSQLTASANELAIALRTTRDLALAESRPETFALDTARRTYSSAGGVARHLGREVDVRLTALDSGARGGTIRFFPDGGSTGGALALTLDKRRLDVTVDWLTGRIAIVEP